MKSTLLCVPVKAGCFEEYKNFAKQILERNEEYVEMLKRYDMFSGKVWHKNINDITYAFVYHDVGPTFEEKVKGLGESTHPFDKWFSTEMARVYDFEHVSNTEPLYQLFDVKV